MPMRVRAKPKQVPESPYNARQIYFDQLMEASRQRQEKCHFAVTISVKKGISGVCRFNPVLDIGCGNPYHGMYRFLQRFNWAGSYIGLDTKIPKEAVEDYKNDIIIKTWPLGKERLPLPPNNKRKAIDISVAYAVNSMGRFDTPEKDFLVSEMQRVAASVVIVGGVNEMELRRWGFQQIGYNDFGDIPEFWGCWLGTWAESCRHRMDAKVLTVQGYFDVADPKDAEKRLFNCKKCGKTEISGNQNFECIHCGAINRERINLDV